MPASTEILDIGIVPETPDIYLVDETDIIVNQVSYSASRDKSEFKDNESCINGLRLANPLLTIQLEGNPIEQDNTNMSDIHPGIQVGTGTSITVANFAAGRFGFDPTEGKVVAEDPSVSISRDSGIPELSVTLINYPHIA